MLQMDIMMGGLVSLKNSMIAKNYLKKKNYILIK